MKNISRRINREVFREVFANELGNEVFALEDVLEDFYANDFDAVRAVLTGPTDRRALIKMLRDKGYGIVLATNPIFPAVAVETRLRWIGLTSEDFDYITTYENSCHSKPNPDYFRDILNHIGRSGEECLMVGSHPIEDMAALKAGLSAYLVTDCIENPDNLPIDEFQHGTFCEAEQYLESLPAVNV